MEFFAEYVEAIVERYTPDYTVFSIHFGQGDPEQGGQHWNFSRSLEDDDGVCTVKEIQQVTISGGILQFSLSKNEVVCKFTQEAAKQTGVSELIIKYEISDELWQRLSSSE